MLILDYDLVNRRIKTNNEEEIERRVSFHSPLLNQKLISEKQDWEITDALSQQKTNCIEWLPLEKGERILEIGANYGTITEMFSEKGGHVCALELDFIKCQIIEKRTAINSNVNVVLGHIDELRENLREKFSKIFLIGVFSKIQDYLSDDISQNGDSKITALNILLSMLTDNGQIIIIDDNRLGIKYFNGAKVTDGEIPFAQVEGVVSARNSRMLLSKTELEQLLDDIPDANITFFYPYPDYKYADAIYSDYRPPKKDELKYDRYNWEKYGYNSFRDSYVYNSLIEEGLFDRFSNSYIAIVSKKTRDNMPIYIKYSNDRSYRYQIRTEIWDDGNRKIVRKIALNSSVKKHLSKMSKTLAVSKDIYSKIDQNVSLCDIRLSEGVLEYDYVEGLALADELNLLICNNEYKKVELIFDKLFNIMADNEVLWAPTDRFREIFGGYEYDHLLHKARISNIDLILPNIIVGKNNHWTIIDYEWGFDVDIPAEYIMWRSIFYLKKSVGLSYNNEKWRKKIYTHFGIDEELQRVFYKMENSFQRYVAKGNVPIRQLRAYPTNIVSRDCGEYFIMKEDDKWDINSRRKLTNIVAVNGRTHFLLPLKYNECKALRVDPASNKCILHINSITNGYGVNLAYKTNCSRKCPGENYLFLHNDPQIVIEDMSNVIDRIEFDYEITNLPRTFSL